MQAFLVHDTLEIAVQVNGKLRGRFSAPAASTDEELSELAQGAPERREPPGRARDRARDRRAGQARQLRRALDTLVRHAPALDP